MNPERSIKLLTAHGIKPTANRILILNAITDQGNPLSMKEIETRLLTVDKSVISRTLALFRDHRLVHAIESADGAVHYETCLSHDEAHDDDEHVHFFCEKCHRTFCLTEVPVPEISVPAGFKPTETNVIVRGLCPECASKK